MTKLDEIAIGIEITLISIVEGFALSALAASVLPAQGLPFEYLPYALAGLLFLLIFWSQSVAHAVSFIRWPLSIGHMLLYFVAAFIQVIAYGHLTDPTAWFFWWTAFVVVGLALYLLDLGIIHRERPFFSRLPGGDAFMNQVERRHRFEMLYIVSAALILNIGALIFCVQYPLLIADARFVMLSGLFQCVVAAVVLFEGMHNFARRCQLVGDLYPVLHKTRAS